MSPFARSLAIGMSLCFFLSVADCVAVKGSCLLSQDWASLVQLSGGAVKLGKERSNKAGRTAPATPATHAIHEEFDDQKDEELATAAEDIASAAEAVAVEDVASAGEVHDAEDLVDESIAKLPEVKWRDVNQGGSKALKTGDIVLYSSTGATAKIIKKGTGSEWTHISLVVVLNKAGDFWEVVAEQASGTVLATAEVANHAAADMITGTSVHGFQVLPLLEKVTLKGSGSEHDLSSYDYGKIAFLTLAYPLTKNQLAKLRNVMSCLHAVRTRYEKGKNLARLAKMTMHWNSEMDLTQMFCSDFVGYATQEIGVFEIPEDVGKSKNLSPGDFWTWSTQGGPWNAQRGLQLDIPNAGVAMYGRTHKHPGNKSTAVEFLPKDPAELWHVMDMRYTHELVQCNPTHLTALQEDHDGYDGFLKKLDEESGTERLWGGYGTWKKSGSSSGSKKYLRLSAAVVGDNRQIVIFLGGESDGWKPDSALDKHILKKPNPGAGDRNLIKSETDETMLMELTLQNGKVFNFEVEGLKASRFQSRDLYSKSLAGYVGKILKELGEWAQHTATVETLNARTEWDIDIYPVSKLTTLREDKALDSQIHVWLPADNKIPDGIAGRAVSS